jgi:hypothetical protein
MSSDKDEEKTEHLKFKIVFLGDAAVGKTSLTRQLAHLEVQTQWVLLCCFASEPAGVLAAPSSRLAKSYLRPDLRNRVLVHMQVPANVRS